MSFDADSDVEFEELFEEYHPSKTRGKNDDKEDRYNVRLEDITQLAPHSKEYVIRTSEADDRHKNRKGRFRDVALVLRRVPHRDQGSDVWWSKQLEIQSPTLREAFKKIAKGFTSASLEQNPIIIQEPFAELYFCRDRISQAIKEAPQGQIKDELLLLEKFRDEYMGEAISAIETSMTEGRITSENLWCLYPVGSLVVLENNQYHGKNLAWCATVKSCIRQNKKDDLEEKPALWLVRVQFTSFNGKGFNHTAETLSIGGFRGFREIRSLLAYPFDMHSEKYHLQRALIERGRKYVDLCRGKFHTIPLPGRGSHCLYKGSFWDIVGQVPFLKKPNRQHDGRLIVDPEQLTIESSWFTETINGNEEFGRPRRSGRPRPFYDSYSEGEEPIKEPSSEEMDGDIQDIDLLTAPPTIAAFSLPLRIWGLVDIDALSSITWKDETLDLLQMDPRRKSIIRGVIESHQAATSTFDDLIPGKGRGLVFLLYGPPGCGKTMTAESVSETLRRPLYHVSGSDLRSTGSNPEWELRLIFKRIARWEAILLFDEADTIVYSRDSARGNDLTPVLLRTLEYQSGVIFLTTNRISDFDKALFSRVHVTLEFAPLDSAQRRTIWKQLASQNGEGGHHNNHHHQQHQQEQQQQQQQEQQHNFSEADFDRLSKLPLNGRTIKNILRVASLHVKARDRTRFTFHHSTVGRPQGGEPTDKEEVTTAMATARNEKEKEKQKQNRKVETGTRMGIEDIEDILRLTLGDPEDEEVERAVEMFYRERGEKGF